jgi:hypothetical protein
MGRHGLGKRNENGDIFIELCVNYDLMIDGSFSRIKTYIKPHRWLQIIPLLTKSTLWPSVRNGRSLLDVRGYRRADVASDHYIVVAQIKIKLAANNTPSERITRKKFNNEKLTHGEIRKKFEEELKESPEQEKMQELDPTEHWTKIKEIMSSKCENVLGLRQRTDARDWIMEESWNEIDRRKITKQKINNADDKLRPILLAVYSEINKRVKRYARCDKQHGQTNLLTKPN